MGLLYIKKLFEAPNFTRPAKRSCGRRYIMRAKELTSVGGASAAATAGQVAGAPRARSRSRLNKMFYILLDE